MMLRGKFIAPILLSTLATLLIGAALLVQAVGQTTGEQLELSLSALKAEQQSAADSELSALESKADNLGLFMSKTAPDLVLSYDFSTLKNYQDYAAKDRDVAYSAYLKPDGQPMIDFKAPADKSQIIEKRYEIRSEDEVLGYVLLGMSKRGMLTNLATSDARINDAVAQVKSHAGDSLSLFMLIMALDVVGVLVLIGGIAYLLFRKLVISPLLAATETIDGLTEGNGDLTRRLPVPNNDEISGLCRSVNHFIEHLQDMVSNIVKDVHQLSGEASDLRGAGAELQDQSEGLRQGSTQVATAMHEMAATVQEVASNARGAADAANEADERAGTGKQIVQSTIGAIDELSKEIDKAAEVINAVGSDSDNIGGVLDVIRGIAEQTNLLALNAAIEAARAGEQGRGFAVVADEVRTLASRTQTSTEEIQKMIERLQSGSRNAVVVMQQSTDRAQRTVAQAADAGGALEQIAEAVNRISQMNTQIATAAEEQSTVADEINQNVTAVNNIGEKTAESADRTATSSENLSRIARSLEGMVGRFHI